MLSPTARILVVRLSAVGDVVNTLPAIGALRSAYPRAFIGWVVEDRAFDLIRDHPALDRVHLFPRRRWVRDWRAAVREAPRLIRELRAQRYDLALDFQGNLKSTLHALASGASLRIGFARGYCKEGSHLFTHKRTTPPPDRPHRIDKNVSLVAALGVLVQEVTFSIPRSPESHSRVTAFLTERNLGRFAIVHPGTSGRGRDKRWVPERFGELCRLLPLPCVVTWGPGERSLAGAVAEQGGAILAPATPSLLDVTELLRHAALFIGCDSGPMRLADAVGTPSVVLFGPTDPAVHGPYAVPHRVVYKKGRGMASISVAEVHAAATEMLSL